MTLALIVCCSVVQAKAADAFEDLEQTQQDIITRICTPLQFERDAITYRDCLQKQFLMSQRAVDPVISEFNALSFDEQYAVQQACLISDPAVTGDNAQCISEQLSAVKKEPVPDLANVTQDEQYVISQQCFEPQTSDGVLAYRRCINTAIAPLSDLPKADFTQKNPTQSNNIQLECSLYSSDVAGYRKCLLTSLGIAFSEGATRESTTETATVVVTSTESESESESESILNPDVDTNELTDLQQAAVAPPEGTELASLDDDELNLTGSTKPTESLTETTETAQAPAANEFPPNQLQQLLQRAQSQFDSLSSNQRVTLFTGLAIALLAGGLWVARKSDKHAVTSRGGARKSADTRHQRTTQRRRKAGARLPARPNLEPVESAQELPIESATVSEEAMNETYANTISPDAATHSPDDVSHPDLAAAQKNGIDNNATHKQFTQWLHDLPAHLQEEFAIELLIYWMAYSDNRFDPDMKREVLQMRDPDERSLIKRWAFLKDADALSGAICFIQEHCSSQQREQIIDLLMAMLINENALTPIQNNMLRFLADAFGIGTDGLNRQYKRAYGQNIPAIPRPDKNVWWDTLNAEQKLRWDARAVAIQPDNIRHRIALGQPLSGELDKDAVTSSFNLAARRCHHTRVSKLGEREQALMNAQMKKFENARDALLGVVA